MSLAGASAPPRRHGRDVGFAFVIVGVLAVFFLPIPPFILDLGLALSIALAVLILMVALWIERPLDFSAFPTVLLVATMLRLSLNIASTRLILSHGAEGPGSAGYIIAGFSQLAMGGDFIIGLIVFVIVVAVNFLVITKGATRIAEVGARFTLDAVPGKQMAIDADLSAGTIDEREAQRRRRELEEESAFFGAMDGASKFVRGDAIAGIVILAVNICGGALLGLTRHGMSLAEAADVFIKLSVGEGLVAQIPALIVSLAAGLIVARGGVRGTAEQTVFSQLAGHSRAAFVAAALLAGLSLVPGLPMLPFAVLGATLALLGRAARTARAAEAGALAPASAPGPTADPPRDDFGEPAIELRAGRQVAARLVAARDDFDRRIGRIRQKLTRRYGLAMPSVRIAGEPALAPKAYEIYVHGVRHVGGEARPGETLVVIGDGRRPDYPGDETRDPAFGMRAVWVPETLSADLRRDGFAPIDSLSIVLTHLNEVLRANLGQWLSYGDMRRMIERLDPEYRRLVDEICPTHLSFSGLQSVLKLLLAERAPIRNLHLVLEAVAEAAPHARRPEQIVEHVRMRMAQQICGDLSEGGALKILRLGARWDLAFARSLKRDGRGDVVEFDLDPRLIEEFSVEAAAAIRARMDEGHSFVLLAAADARPFVRMVVERLFPNLSVLSHLELARGLEIVALGAIA